MEMIVHYYILSLKKSNVTNNGRNQSRGKAAKSIFYEFRKRDNVNKNYIKLEVLFWRKLGTF